MFSAWKHS